MLNYKSDLENTYSIINNDYTDGYDKLYFSSNEDLRGIFNEMDFTGKKVLTVLSSGDQVFHFYNHNATDVDLFDKNKLTLYFYYLRIWIIEINNKYSLPDATNNIYIERLLKRVRPKTEEEYNAYNYWKEYIKKYHFDRYSIHRLEVEKPNRKSPIDNLDKIKSNTKLRNINFYNIDIARDNLSLNKKYDVIYVSNIVDWLCFDQKLYRSLANNLYNLVEDDGFIICADLGKTGEPGIIEAEEMLKKYELFDLPGLEFGQISKPGYCYRKKK